MSPASWIAMPPLPERRRGFGGEAVVAEAGGECSQRGVEVPGEIGVGTRGPPVVARTARGEDGTAHRERVERVGRLPGPSGDEVDNRAFPGVIVDGRARDEFGYRTEQGHPQTQFRDILGLVVVG